MEEKDFTLLDNFFKGLLSPQEEEAVRMRVRGDAGFAQEYRLREMEFWLKDQPRRQALSDKLNAIGTEYLAEMSAKSPELPRLHLRRRRWALLAAALALAAAAIWFLRPQPPSYRQYADHAPLQLTELGAGEQLASEAETSFNRKDYASALRALRALAQNDPDNPTFRLYEGICLLELGRPAEARVVFEPIAEGRTLRRADAVWYLALSYLAEKDIGQCRAALLRLESGDDHYRKAQELLKRLN